MFDIGIFRVGLRRSFLTCLFSACFTAYGGVWSVPVLAAEKVEHVVATAVVGSWPVDLHPLTSDELGHVTVKRYITRPVLEQAPSGPVCIYCVSIPSEADGSLRFQRGADGKWETVARYVLRPDAKWADGVAVTATDVGFSWQVMRNSGGISAPLDTRSTEIKDIRVIDTRTFEVVHDGMLCGPRLTVPPLVPSHLEQKIWAADPQRYFEHSLYKTKPETPGLYSGPFRLVRMAGGTLKLARNAFWLGQSPAFDGVTVAVAANKVDLEKLVREGKIDTFTTLEFDVGRSLAKDLADKYTAFYAPSDFLVHLRPNFDNPVLADVRVRKALMYGLDREGLVASLLDNKGTVAQSLLSPFMPGYAVVDRYTYNPQKAAALLDEAGWVKGKDGHRRNTTGKPLRFEIRYRRTQPWIDLTPQLVKAWGALGAQVDMVEDPQLTGDAVDSRQRYPGFVGFSEWLLGGVEVARYWYHSAMIPSAANGWQGSNYFGIKVPAFDAAMDRLLTASCAVEPRQAALVDLQKAYAEGLPALPLWFGTVITLSDHRLEGTVDARTFAAAPIENWRLRP
ncbi:peptide/nickel transport system substrate-binding protein [Nitrospirillum amazonense]|uniref:Peptide/nickel transport system substrate-binding protein n=1 Tax=Nitrospirillum amazonense TaxID=28077 RepID=A0A560FSV2_9PROT|nr:ABC transporter substrate-binding protein [Nitrospirillum amazonense]TWB24641.1 peptide/nickel transport system substrate-binding protein [Nitrospirillum amazonense]